jgi:hypothetical protein
MAQIIEKPNVILQSDLIETRRGSDFISYEKRIYIDCSCGCYGDASRIVLSRSAMRNKDDFEYETDVSFEFDVRGSTEISRETYWVATLPQKIYMRLDRARKRIIAAFRILTGQPVYLPNSQLINFAGTKRLCRTLLSSIEELEKKELPS